MTINTNTFNSIARFYDILSFIIFRNAIKNSQLFFLNKIPSGKEILIIGGGTGWYLYELLKINHCKKITYVEASPEMIQLTKRKLSTLSHTIEIEFIEAPIENVNLQGKFDVVITNYILDVFKEEKLKIVMNTIYSLLKNEGWWMFTDFKISHNSLHRYWQIFLIRSMYAFFKITSRIEANKLLSFEQYFHLLNLKKTDTKSFYSKMIESVIYKK
jgi:spermidine synthase